MLVLKSYNYRMIQSGPRSYYTMRLDFGNWVTESPTELLDTYPKTTEESMREDWEVLVGEPPEEEYRTKEASPTE